MSTTRLGYVPDNTNKIFQDYKCRDVGSCRIMGIF
jgi:hypothetical protein